jgi:nitrite reductase (NADH) small subunit
VGQWVRVCGVAEAPQAGEAMEADAAGVGICLANVGGELSALDNLCPHRGAPLGQGWVEGGAVVCPWHSWTFNVKLGRRGWLLIESIESTPFWIPQE